MKVKCDNCGFETNQVNLKVSLADIPDLGKRLDPGGVVPAGECPKCGALTYPVKGHVSKFRLTVDVDYIPHGTSKKVLEEMLVDLVEHASSVGLMTRETDAEVENWTARVDKLN